MKQYLINFLIIMAMIVLSSCTAQNHGIPDTPIIHGFWYGLWNGMICPVTFIISLFNDNVVVWETHNNGAWYSFGFLIGAGVLFGGSSKSSK